MRVLQNEVLAGKHIHKTSQENTKEEKRWTPHSPLCYTDKNGRIDLFYSRCLIWCILAYSKQAAIILWVGWQIQTRWCEFEQTFLGLITILFFGSILYSCLVPILTYCYLTVSSNLEFGLIQMIWWRVHRHQYQSIVLQNNNWPFWKLFLWAKGYFQLKRGIDALEWLSLYALNMLLLSMTAYNTVSMTTERGMGNYNWPAQYMYSNGTNNLKQYHEQRLSLLHLMAHETSTQYFMWLFPSSLGIPNKFDRNYQSYRVPVLQAISEARMLLTTGEVHHL